MGGVISRISKQPAKKLLLQLSLQQASPHHLLLLMPVVTSMISFSTIMASRVIVRGSLMVVDAETKLMSARCRAMGAHAAKGTGFVLHTKIAALEFAVTTENVTAKEEVLNVRPTSSAALVTVAILAPVEEAEGAAVGACFPK